MSKGTAVITGGSTGIGAVYADRLAKRGYDLLLVARDERRLGQVAGRLGTKVECLRADLTKDDDIEAVAARLRDDNAVTLLLNCAGVGLFKTFREASRPAIDTMMKLNMVATTRLAHAAALAFSKRGRGTIINVASSAGMRPFPADPAYAASKAYILALTQSISDELSAAGVRVQVVVPGPTRTEIFERAGHDIAAIPAELVMEVDDMVDAGLAGLDQGEVVTIPALADISRWQTYASARADLGGKISGRHPAPRYGVRQE